MRYQGADRERRGGPEGRVANGRGWCSDVTIRTSVARVRHWIERLRQRTLLWAALWLMLALAAGRLIPPSYLGNRPIAFYAACLIAAGAIAAAVHGSALARSAMLGTILGTLSLTLLLLAAALPIADLTYTRAPAIADALLRRPATAAAGESVRPVYSFRAAKGDPRAFEAWWEAHAQEWYRNGAPRLEAPDPAGVLPFVLVPNGSARIFDSIVRINALGFRGDDFVAEKDGRYRIFAIGESPTFGTTRRADDRTWPQALQALIDRRLACARSVQVINAGVEAYHLRHNLERLRRDVLPLAPDLVISYHSYNSLALLDERLAAPKALPPPERAARASALLGAVEFRWRLRQFIQTRQQLESFTPTEAEMRASPLATAYGELIALGRVHRFAVALATASLAITPDSPEEVIEFYDRVFINTRRSLAAAAAHNRLLASIARESGTTLIDTTGGLAGEWDADLFIDLVHFTQKGTDVFAERVFDGTAPLLTGDKGPGCVKRS
jgi:lysophospholipase L1-like esterase